MLGKIQPGPNDWEKLNRSSTDRKRGPQNDTYRKVEKDKQSLLLKMSRNNLLKKKMNFILFSIFRGRIKLKKILV